MFSTIFKKKLSNSELSQIFVNGVLDVIDKGFKEVMGLIEVDPSFVRKPDLTDAIDGPFTMIVIIGNLSLLDQYFEPQQSTEIEELIISKFAETFEMTDEEFKKHLSNYKSFMSRVNHPSKNILYAMPKALFFKYNLNDFQDEYFKDMHSPNPLLLKRMEEVFEHFIWSWDAFFKKYKTSI